MTAVHDPQIAQIGADPDRKHGIPVQIALVMENEGGYVHHKDDFGGETNAGVTVPAWREYCMAVGRGDAGRSMRSLTLEDVTGFYGWWWRRPETGLPLLRSRAVQLFTFDSSVLFGPGRSARWLQTAAQTLGQVVTADGHVGPLTSAAVNALEPERVVRVLHGMRAARHRMVSDKNPSQKVFLKGWLARADRMRDLCLGWAQEEKEEQA